MLEVRLEGVKFGNRNYLIFFVAVVISQSVRCINIKKLGIFSPKVYSYVCMTLIINIDSFFLGNINRLVF
jgi:hypothetical protein